MYQRMDPSFVGIIFAVFLTEQTTKAPSVSYIVRIMKPNMYFSDNFIVHYYNILYITILYIRMSQVQNKISNKTIRNI